MGKAAAYWNVKK